MKFNKITLKTFDKKDIIAYNIKFNNGFEVEILNLGGIITKIITPDKDNNLENIVLGYDNIESYIKNPSYFGAIIGRTAGRICEGRITIEDKDYNLANNYDPHQGHGGNIGFNNKIWDVEVLEYDNKVILEFKITSEDMEENYPGKVYVKVSFIVHENYKIEEVYDAVSDKTTLVNMTNHSYFNLSGNVKRPITEQNLIIDSDYILEIDETCVPTGKRINVENTPFDFRKINSIGDRIDDNNKQIEIGCGYDHTFLLNKNNKMVNQNVAQNDIYIEDEISGRSMTIDTDQKCVLVYSMNFPDDLPLYNKKQTQRRYGICFETQAPPIGKNMCFIEDSLLKKDEKYIQKTIYKFGIK